MRLGVPLTLTVLGIVGLQGYALAKMSVVNTKHNLSVTGPGEVKALTEDRICIFCHTPHNAAPATPLWNRELQPVNYSLYESSTLNPRTDISQPTGPSRLCLSCHDGTIALGKVLSSPTEISLTSRYIQTDLGTDISDDHPVSFHYSTSLPDEELSPTLPSGLLFYGTDMVHCSTCHDAHDDTNGMFLAVDNRYSNLCTMCHLKEGWSATSHNLSSAAWNGVEPNPWPHNLRHSALHQWQTVHENGCQNCHKPHTAGGPQRLLNYLAEESNCFPCHNGNVAQTDIQAEFSKLSVHPIEATTIGLTQNAHDPAESPLVLQPHVECADCHNPHASEPNLTAVQAPYAPGSLNLVSGVDQTGAAVPAATYEYEICYKCHTEYNPALPFLRRVVDENNVRIEFSSINPSYHPVTAQGKNLDVPSLPNVNYNPEMTAASLIYCTDCHAGDNTPDIGGTGPAGPHGSMYAPILRERYETVDNTIESYDNYALCYRCHERLSILADESFQQKAVGSTLSRGGHSGHLGSGAPCSVCHDPHGVQDDGFSGDHTHLLNFDALIVTPVAGQSVPFFTDLGSRSGSCTLVCHGKTHDPNYTGSDPNFVNSTYP